MNVFKFILIFVSLPAALMAQSDIAPAPIPLEKYARLWENSPFELGVTKGAEKPTGVAAEWILTSLSKMGDKPVVTLLNRTSNESAVLSPGLAGPEGMELVDADVKDDYLQSSVHIRRGSEIAKLTFQQSELNSLQKNQPPGMPQPPVAATGAASQPTTAFTPPRPPPGAIPIPPAPPRRIFSRPPTIGPATTYH